VSSRSGLQRSGLQRSTSRSTCGQVYQPRALALAVACLGLMLTAPCLCAQQEAGIERVEAPLIDQQPFDLITLTDAAGGGRFKIAPLATRVLPPSPKPTDKLTVVLTKFPEREYEIAWAAIAKIDLYEQQIYDEALRKLEEKDFIGAFQNLSFLMKNYPNMPRLEGLRQEFLFKSAAERFRAGELLQTLSALEELQETAPAYQAATVLAVLSRVASTLIDNYQKDGDLTSSKALLTRLKSKFGAEFEAVKEWEAKLQQLALAKRDEAVALLAAKKYREARRAAVEMLGIFPELPDGQNLIEEINRIHPMVRVGVMQRSTELDPSSLINWPARRTGRLVYQPIFQFLETGAEGGRYGFALGTYRLSDDRQQLILSLDPALLQTLNAFGVAQACLSRAVPGSPAYDPSWAAIFKSVEASSGSQVTITLKRPNVLPHALLQWIFPETEKFPAELPGDYVRKVIDGNETAFALREGVERRGQPVEIVEIFYSDPKEAVNDLLRGELDILDQLYPADAKRLAIDSRLVIGSYALPSTHMLIPISDDPFLAKDKFRRALLYATNRQGILTGELLNSENHADGRVISGPFPLGAGETDPLAYAYNPAIRPAAYNSQLAKLLVVMTEQEMRTASEKSGEPVPKRKKLIVGSPDFEFARVAVQAMIQQWAIVGIQAEMMILPPDQTRAASAGCDLIYVTTTMWEPATDIERLLGGNGIAATDNPFIIQALEKLRSARNWREVRVAMQDIHQLVDYHLPVLPLWQVTDRFAASRYVEGLANKPVSLYQDVDSWRLNLGFSRTAQR